MLREPNNRTLLLVLWAVLICCVVIGSLAPAASPLMVVIARLRIWDKLQHFGAYLALSFLPVIGLVIVGAMSLPTDRHPVPSPLRK